MRIHRAGAFWIAVVVVGLGPVLGLAPPRLAIGATTVLSFLPTDDGYVFVAKPARNYGSAGDLLVKSGAKERRSFLRFEVEGIVGNVVGAELRLQVTDSGPAGGDVHAATTDWTEAALTWNSQPSPTGARLASIGRVTSGTTRAIPLGTGVVSGDGPVAFRIAATSTNLVGYASGESATPPELAITLAPAPTSTPPPTPTPTLDPTPTPTVDPTPTPTTDPTPTSPPDQVLVGAGDIANCSLTTDDATANLLDGITGTVLTAGDNVYPDGTAAEFANCYEPTWGRHKARTRPAPGNHDYHTPGATGYYGYFGSIAGDPAQGWYSYGLAGWHVVVLNSNCTAIGGCGAGSNQEAWLRSDLAAHPTSCTLGYWHHPLFSSGKHGGDGSVRPFWQALYDAGADIVISGHDHDYERFAPQTPTGVTDPDRGIREFIVGTGGAGLRPFVTIQPNSEARNSTDHGVIVLTLRPTGYDWRFEPIAGATFTDAGSGECH